MNPETNRTSSNAKQPLVSLGLPTYNRPQFLRRALKCLTEQTFRNLEIIISDNCSPEEETQKVVREFQQRDPRIQYYRQEENIGAARNHLFVLDKAVGEYFVWVGDDDEWHEKFIETGVQSLAQNPQYDAWCCSAYLIDTYSRVVRKLLPSSRFTRGSNKRDTLITYLREPESTHKANVFLSLFRRAAICTVRKAYEFQDGWGRDICLVVAFLTRFNLLTTDEVLFYKRVMRSDDHEADVHHLHPSINMFPISESMRYIREHYKAARHTPYQNLVLAIMLLRLPIAIRYEWLSKRGINKLLGKFGYRIVKIKHPETPVEF